MIGLPSELWHRIAHFLEDDDLDRVFPVNSALFNLSMDHRWRQIVFETRTLAKAMKILDRLSYVCPIDYAKAVKRLICDLGIRLFPGK